MDPRQAIDEWIIFAQEKNYPLVTGQRKFDRDIDRINTILQEEESLFLFCRARRMALSETLRSLVDGPPTREGHEHRVFYHLENDPPRVTKVTFPHKYGRFEYTPFLYLERLALSNFLFPALDIRFEDFVKAETSQFSIISSMRAFAGGHPRLASIKRLLEARGFEEMTGTTTIDFVNPSIGIYLRDCHPLNWVRSRDGTLIPIDVIPERVV